MQFPEDLDTQSPEDLDMKSENLDMKFKNLDMKFENLNMKFKNLDIKFKNLNMKSEYLNIQSAENQSYQLQFLFKNRADKFQNFFKDSNSLKLFQLFFTVKKIKNIVKQTNQQTAYTSFDTF